MGAILTLGDPRITAELCGVKAARLSDMVRLGFPVPAGFVIVDGLASLSALDIAFLNMQLADWTRKGVSIRSSGVVSMPGMLDTVLDVGTLEEAQAAIAGVFNSWWSERAVAYRKLQGIPEKLNISVIVQKMVYGDLDYESGTGIAFTRNPINGEDRLYGEYLSLCRGDALASGKVIPETLEEMPARLYKQLFTIGQALEYTYGAPQEIEFTVQQGELFVLQTRDAKIVQAEHFMIDPTATLELIAFGTPASPGVGTGVLVFDLDGATRQLAAGHKIVFVAQETTPYDFKLMSLCEGFFTLVGGATSHSSVVARALKKPAVVGCGHLELTADQLKTPLGNVYREGDLVTIDGTSGIVIRDSAPLVRLISNS